MIPAFQNIGIFEREGFVVFSVLVVYFLIQEIGFILLPILLDFSHNIVQSDMTSCGIVTHILLLVQGFQVLEDVVRCVGGTDQEGTGNVMLLFEVTTHRYASIGFSTTPGTTEHEQGW